MLESALFTGGGSGSSVYRRGGSDLTTLASGTVCTVVRSCCVARRNGCCFVCVGTEAQGIRNEFSMRGICGPCGYLMEASLAVVNIYGDLGLRDGVDKRRGSFLRRVKGFRSKLREDAYGKS